MTPQKEIAYILCSGRIEFSLLPESDHPGIPICPELAESKDYRSVIEEYADRREGYPGALFVRGVPDRRGEEFTRRAVRAFSALVRVSLWEEGTPLHNN